MTYVLLAALGATFIVTHGSLFETLREKLPDFVSCPQCSGFWIGLMAGTAQPAESLKARIVTAVLLAFSTSFIAFVVAKASHALEHACNHDHDDNDNTPTKP